MGHVWSAPARLRRRSSQHECGRSHNGDVERLDSTCNEDLRRYGSTSFVLMIDSSTRQYRLEDVVPEQMRVQRLTVVVLVFVGVQMHVHERSGNRSELHEDPKRGSRQPAKHSPIVVNHVAVRV